VDERHQQSFDVHTTRWSDHDQRALRLLCETSGIGFWHIDVQGYTRYANPAMCEMLELSSPADLDGKTHHQFFTPESLELVHIAGEKRSNGLSSTYEVELVGMRGGRRNVVISGVPVTDDTGRFTGRIGTFTDITERKRTEDALHTSETALRSLFAASVDAIGVSRAGIHVMVNPAYVRMFGATSAQELEGTSILDLIAPSERATVMNHVRARSLGQTNIKSYVTRGLRRDGREFPMEVHVSSYTASNAVNTVVILRDITERLDLEEQLRQSQKMDALGRLAGGVAHDFNNLLTVIMSCADLALRGLPQTGRLAEDIRLIRATGERAATLTRQLLAVSRRQVIDPKVFDLNVVVGEMGSMLRRLIGTHITLTIDSDPALAHVRVDSGQIEQVVMNLCVNARDAMPGGGMLTLKTRNVVLDEQSPGAFRQLPPGPYVVFSVTDTGHGMTAEVQRRLFEPFFTTKSVGKGTGLGLATVYGIVKQSGGDIVVETTEGRGTTMHVYLPAVNEPVERVSAVLEHRAPGTGQTVLLAEDEPSLRDLIERFLSAMGYRVLAAADGAEALALFAREAASIDVVVTDMVMPGMSGIELAKEIDARAPTMRMLFMSGYAFDGASILTSRPGSAFVAKPFTLPVLAARVATLLQAPRDDAAT
jgi:two-component system, cell cycle sensor histidine kinase and response regulator CckA